MGNYMETCIQRKQREEKQHDDEQEEELKKDEKPGGGFGKEKGRMRVKLVMTKEELGWLLLQLQSKQGKKLEDLFGEIEKGRSGRNANTQGWKWKPSLESIMESPEVLEMDRVH